MLDWRTGVLAGYAFWRSGVGFAVCRPSARTGCGRRLLGNTFLSLSHTSGSVVDVSKMFCSRFCLLDVRFCGTRSS